MHSTYTRTLISVPDGVIWHVSPIRTARRIININVVVFGLIQRTKTETGCWLRKRELNIADDVSGKGITYQQVLDPRSEAASPQGPP